MVVFQSGAICLHAAAEKGHTSVIRSLLTKGAPVDAVTKVSVGYNDVMPWKLNDKMATPKVHTYKLMRPKDTTTWRRFLHFWLFLRGMHRPVDSTPL